MKIKYAKTLAMLSLGVFALAACSGSGDASSAGESAADSSTDGAEEPTEPGSVVSEPITVKAAWVPTIHTTHWAVAQQFIEDENITLDLSPFKTNNEMMVAMQGGSIDFMTMGYNNTISALDRGDLNYKYVAGISEGGTRILIRDGVEVESWDDLRGLTVGTAQGSTQYQQLVLAAEAHGLDIEQDTDFVNIGSAPDMILAMMNGDVDVISVWEPSASEGLMRGYGYEVPEITDTFYSDSFRLNSGLAVSDAFAEANPEVVQVILEAFEKAQEQVSSDTEWWINEFMQLSSSDPEVLATAIENVTPVTALDVDEIKSIAKSLHSIGLVSEDYSDRVEDYILTFGN